MDQRDVQRKIKKLVKKEVGSVAKRRVKKEEATLYALFVRETCRGVLTRNNSSTITLSCDHRFHRYCLIPWIDTCTRNNNPLCCPLCRGEILNNELPEGTSRPQAPEGNGGTFVTDDRFDMNGLQVIRTSINYEIGRGILSELIINSSDEERSLYFLLIRTVVGLGVEGGDFTAQGVLNIYRGIRTQYDDPNNGLPTRETPFYLAMGDDINLLEAWIRDH